MGAEKQNNELGGLTPFLTPFPFQQDFPFTRGTGKMKPTSFLILLVLCLTGCSMIYLFLPMSMTDIGKTESGELYVKDSRRNWSNFTNDIESSFQKELGGEEFWYRSIASPNPPKTWPAWWKYTIQRMKIGEPVLYENPERLINYIHWRRAELGLPPVRFEKGSP